MTKRLECTCIHKNEPTPKDHTRKCQLQKSDRFLRGSLVWNMHQQRLTTKGEAIDDEVAAEKADLAMSVIGDIIKADYPQCPQCNTDTWVNCSECGSHWIDCECKTLPEDWYCNSCGLFFHMELDTDIDMLAGEESDEQELVEIEPCSCTPIATYCWKCGVRQNWNTKIWSKIDTTFKSSYTGIVYGPKCRHYNEYVTFPDGVKVYVSSMNNKRTDDDIVPEWGLYCDYGWHPTWRAEHINWPDFQLPLNYETASEAITYAYEMAKAGWVVEIGCIGGHGRTGTALACMAILGGVPAGEAVDWVHKNHCTEAIENTKQEWFPLWFDAHVNGGEAPPMPVYTASTSVGTCTEKQHFAMMKLGKEACTQDDDCRWWNTDMKKYILESSGGGTLPVASTPVALPMAQAAPTEEKNTAVAEAVAIIEASLAEDNVNKYAPTRCVRPGCNQMLHYGTLECKCGVKYTMRFWETRDGLNKHLEPRVGSTSGGFVYAGKESGWILDNRNNPENIDPKIIGGIG